MSLQVFAAVVLAAFLHATWNALLKTETDKYAGSVALCVGSLPLAFGCLIYAGLPAPESWAHVLASGFIHTFYFVFLLNAYRAADFTQVYPVARGAAPVLTAILGTVLLGEILSPVQSAAVAVIAAGVTSLVFSGRGPRGMTKAGLGWALATSVVIATYSLNDGAGARLAGNSFAFYGASSILNCLLLCAYMRVVRPGAISRSFVCARKALLVGGPMSFVAYALVTWAFSHAPIATVSALREISILFAVLIGTFVLKERMNWRKIGSTFVTLMGVLLLRFAR